MEGMDALKQTTDRASWLGPVFFWEVIRLSRRGAWHGGRLAFALTLLVCIYFEIGNRELKQTELNQYSEWIARLYYSIQRLAVIFLTPALVAGAILDERNKQTLPLLLSSMLSPREIVYGKLAGRLLGLLAILLAGLPILALMQFLGGIDFFEAIGQLWLALLIMLFLAMTSICMSCQSRTLGGAIARTYLRSSLHFLYGVILTLPIALLFSTYWDIRFALVSVVLSLLVCQLFAIVSTQRLIRNLSEVALHSHLPDNQVISSNNNAWSDLSHLVWNFRGWMGASRASWEYRFEARTDAREYQEDDVAIRYYRIPEVTNRPLMWKDTFFPIDRRMQFFLTAGSIALGTCIMLFLVSILGTTSSIYGLEGLIRWLAWLSMLLVVGVIVLRASGCFAEEIQHRTIDMLLMWPWSKARIVLEKCLAIFRRYRILLLVELVLILPMICATFPVQVFWIIPLFIAQLIFLITLCVWLSLRYRNWPHLVRAIAVGLVFCALTVIPEVAKLCWRYAPPVVLQPDAWAHSITRSTERDSYSRVKREIVPLQEWVDASSQVPTYWLYAGQTVRNVLCPLEAWNDVMHVRYYWLPRAKPVSFSTAMQTNSLWYVHGMTILTLLCGSGVFFGRSLWLLRRG